nr:hypothetical protein CFP56_29925 [Quercus suber]
MILSWVILAEVSQCYEFLEIQVLDRLSSGKGKLQSGFLPPITVVAKMCFSDLAVDSLFDVPPISIDRGYNATVVVQRQGSPWWLENHRRTAAVSVVAVKVCLDQVRYCTVSIHIGHVRRTTVCLTNRRPRLCGLLPSMTRTMIEPSSSRLLGGHIHLLLLHWPENRRRHIRRTRRQHNGLRRFRFRIPEIRPRRAMSRSALIPHLTSSSCASTVTTGTGDGSLFRGRFGHDHRTAWHDDVNDSLDQVRSGVSLQFSG